jgi:hypothetical protein
MGIYARETVVPAERSKAEIEATLRRYGADQFVSGWKQHVAVIGFVMRDRQVRFTLPLPQLSEFGKNAAGAMRSHGSQQAAYEQAVRQRWRALALAIKAKLECVESGIATFEEEFMAHIVMPNGMTAGEWLVPQIAEAYDKKKMPPLLMGAG